MRRHAVGVLPDRRSGCDRTGAAAGAVRPAAACRAAVPKRPIAGAVPTSSLVAHATHATPTARHDLQQMSPQDLDRLVDLGEQQACNTGEKLITQGEEGDYFYVVEQGGFDFIVNSKKVSKHARHFAREGGREGGREGFLISLKFCRCRPSHVQVGDCTAGATFGDLALLFNERRAATCLATSRSTVGGAVC